MPILHNNYRTDVVKQSLNNASTGLSQFTFREPRSVRLTLRWRF